MPSHSSILDVCVSEAELPASVQTFSDVTVLYAESRVLTHTYSRRTILSQNVANLVSEFDASDLVYLSEPRSIVDPTRAARAADALEQLFTQMHAQPERAASCSLYECSVQELLDALALPETAPIPEALRDDEGETLRYAIAYLKSHLCLLRHAGRHRQFVVHGQSHHLDGSDA